MQFFFVLGAVQFLPVWLYADSGSVSNLIDKAVYNRLPFKPPIRDPEDVRVIGGNGEALDLKGFVVLIVSLGSNIIWHEIGIVTNFPLEVMIGADVLTPYLCSLLYLKNNRIASNSKLQCALGVLNFAETPRSVQQNSFSSSTAASTAN